MRPTNWRWPILAFLLIPAFLLTTAILGYSLRLPVINLVPNLGFSKLAGFSAIQFLHS